MMDFKITDKNDNIIYQNMTMHNDDAEEISEDEIEMIIKSIGDSSSNIFNFEYVYDEDNYHYSFLKHTDKDSALDELLELIDVYNAHVAALPAHHPTEHSTALERESVSESSNNDDLSSLARDAKASSFARRVLERESVSDESVTLNDDVYDYFRKSLREFEENNKDLLVCGADDLRPESVNSIIGRYLKKNNGDFYRPYSWMRKFDCDGWCDIVKPQHNVDSLFGHYECRGGRDGCEGRDGRGDVLSVLPGTFAGSDKFSRPRDDSCGRDSREGASDDVGPVEEWALSETPTRAIKDFIGYLRTQPTWAALIGKLSYYNDPDDEIGKQKLIDDFCEYMENRESQAKTGADAERR